MSRPTISETLTKIHGEAVAEFDTIQGAVKDERLQCLNDRRFYSIAGAQWEGKWGEQFKEKPKLEVNKVHLAVIRIINEYRNNRISVSFVSKTGDAGDKMTEVCAGLYRADEQDSNAEEALDNAFEEAVGGGMGAWRLVTAYEDEHDPENEAQRIRFEPIFDADSCVFFNLNAKRQDKADATRCFVLTAMAKDAYIAEYGDDLASMNKSITRTEFDWCTPNVVYIAEYYNVELKTEKHHTFKGLDGSELKVIDAELTDEYAEELAATGHKLEKTKRVKSRRVHKYIMNGARILEDCGYIAGQCIPVIVTYGKRWYVDNVERCMGHVRLATDAQRLANMQRSKLAEISALSTVEKPILTPQQVMGHQETWRTDNINNYAYLLLNPITDVQGQSVPTGPVGYTRVPQIPPAMAALLQITEQDMQDLLGNAQAGEEIMPNISGKAVELIQNRLDMQAFIYLSNFAKAVKRCGEVWLSMAKDVLVEEKRKLKTVGGQGEVSTVELQRPVIAEEGGELEYENDLGAANLDVAVEVGPSSSSKRAATVRALTGMIAITQDPETKQVLEAMTMMNMEGEGIGDVRDYFRQKLLRMGVLKPTQEEAKKMAEEKANTPPNAQEEYFRAEATKAQAQGVKANADTILTIARSEETKANTIKTLTDIDASEQEQALALIDRLGVQQPEAQTLPEIIPPQPAEQLTAPLGE